MPTKCSHRAADAAAVDAVAGSRAVPVSLRHGAGARGPWVALVAAAVGCVVVGLSGTDGGVLPPCPFRAMTGLDCPGCGMTRGARALLRGHPAAALGHNVLLVVLVPVAVWAWLAWAGFPVRRLPKLSTGSSWALVGLLGLFAVVRNLPLPGCRWLASS